MTWSINAKGPKPAVLETVKNHTVSVDFGAQETKAYETAKAHVVAVIEQTPDDFELSVSCSGHTTSKDGAHVAASQSLSISAWKAEAAAS